MNPPVRRSRGERLAWVPALVIVPLGAAWTMWTHSSFGALAGVVAMAASAVLHHAAWRRARADLRRHCWMLCPGCRHPLDPSRSAGTCPECGRPYTRVAVRRAWRSRHRAWLGEPVELPPGA